jgi:hydrogenase maturation factor
MTSGAILPAGKLPVTLLGPLLASFRRDSRLIVGPGIGLDAAVIDWNGRYLVAKTDPITFVGEDLGEYALVINANDLAVMGATPRWFLATVLLPTGQTTAGMARRIFRQLREASGRLGVTICGGHTEVSPTVARPIIVGCLLGDCAKPRLITAAGARTGDAVLLTKGLAIEAVSILARERSEELAKAFPAAFLGRCRRFTRTPGISVVRDARLATAAGGVHAMHDPTEGGLSAALYEVAEAADVRLDIMETTIPILPETARLCAYYDLNPLGAIASGSLLLCVDPRYARRVLARFRRNGIKAAHIGRVVARRRGVRLIDGAGASRPFPRFARDEIARLLG